MPIVRVSFCFSLRQRIYNFSEFLSGSVFISVEAFGLVYLRGLFLLKNSMTQSVITLFSSDSHRTPGNSVSKINLLVNKYLLSAY